MTALLDFCERCGRVRLLPRGRGLKLPGELRCVTLHSLHLKPRQQEQETLHKQCWK